MTALDLLLPPSCAGCDRPGTPCCATCLDDFGPPQRIQVPGVGPEENDRVSLGPSFLLFPSNF